MLPERITTLKGKLVEFGTLAERMIEDSVTGLLERRREPLERVLERDEPKSNRFELDIDDLCIQLIAQYQPAARDLRTILMILKMNNDLERMGDHAKNIAQSALFLIQQPPVKPLIDVPTMAQITMEMVRSSVNSFINEDADLAQRVCERDRTVNNLRDQLWRELITYMSSDAHTIKRGMHLMRIGSNLERTADLSTNIAEDVIFMVRGTVIKHHKNDSTSA